jgi:hypothetical protein
MNARVRQVPSTSRRHVWGRPARPRRGVDRRRRGRSWRRQHPSRLPRRQPSRIGRLGICLRRQRPDAESEHDNDLCETVHEDGLQGDLRVAVFRHARQINPGSSPEWLAGQESGNQWERRDQATGRERRIGANQLHSRNRLMRRHQRESRDQIWRSQYLFQIEGHHHRASCRQRSLPATSPAAAPFEETLAAAACRILRCRW